MTISTVAVRLQDAKKYRDLGGNVTSEIMQQFTVQELRLVPRDQLYDLGFANWDDSLVLLPDWMLPLMQPGESLKSIMGDVKTVGTDYIDDDTRGGCLAYGFIHL